MPPSARHAGTAAPRHPLNVHLVFDGEYPFSLDRVPCPP